MYKFEPMETEILKHLYAYWELDINQGWEKVSKLDKSVVDTLYMAELVDKQVVQKTVRLSTRGVGAVLFGLSNADKIYNLL